MNKLLAVSVLLATGSAVAWFSGADKLVLRSGEASPPESARSGTTPRPTDEIQLVRGIGYVEPASEIRRLVFKVDGVIDSVHVAVGQTVDAGAVLVSLRNHDEQAAVAEAEQQLAVATAERDQLLAGAHPDEIEAARRRLDVVAEQLRFAKKHHRRIEELAQKSATTDQERDKAETELRRTEKELQQAEAELAHLEHHVRPEDRHVVESRVQLAASHLEAARSRLENTILKAPFAGTVLEILKREGEGARVLDREPVLVFADESRLRVRAEIDERYVHRLAEGQTAEIYGRGLGDARYSGKVALVKRLMGNKTVFSHEASERKDLDVLQVLIDLPPDFHAPLGLQVDVDVMVRE